MDNSALVQAHWEKQLPGKGEAIMEVLRPFSDWKPELKSEIADLQERAKKAIFWCDIKGVRRILWPADELFWDSLGGSVMSRLMTVYWKKTLTRYWESYRKNSLLMFQDSFRAQFGEKFGDEVLTWFSYPVSLSVIHVVSNEPDEVARLKPLLDLWLAGNFPYGFDRDGHLLVLIAR